jgi:transcription antitermination factor NusG
MQPGQAVRIPEGPFAGYQAVFDCYLAGHQRVRVLLKLLHRQQMPLELPAEEVQPMKQM